MGGVSKLQGQALGPWAPAPLVKARTLMQECPGLCWDALGGALEASGPLHTHTLLQQSPDSLSHGLETFPSQGSLDPLG